ncbi:glycosyltransferase [Algoriphagus sp.]|uniref:glycosyltransferase n=1 Tax=Algoriphagus sp. TaxID=1872435 RepID=UPI00391BCB10
MLSIVIPTYNRNEKVLRLLNKIKTINKEYKLSVVVIDNNSDVSTEDFLRNKKYQFSEEFKIIRNNGNVGLGGNLINSFLNCQTQWMWLLGDDDLPLEDSIQKILNEIENTSEQDFLIKFNSEAGKFPNRNLEIKGIENLIDFCDDFGYYSNMVFISNSIFKTKIILDETFYMSNAIRTMAPHLVGIYRCVEKGFSIRVVNKFITEHGQPENIQDKWDYERLILGLLYFNDSEIDFKIKKKLLPKLLLNYLDGKKRFYRFLLLFPYTSSNGDRFFWSSFLLKTAALYSGFRFFYLIILGVIIRNKFINNFFKCVFKKYKHNKGNKIMFRN